MATARAQNQLALDEQVVEDTELEAALETRLDAQVAQGEARKAFKEANEAAKVHIAKLELPDEHAVRVGRFRISRSAVSARHVAFDVDPTSRVRITLLDGKAPSEGDGAAPEYDAGKVTELRNIAADARQQ